MTVASTTENMSPGLREVAERAKQEPEGRFYSLAHLIDVSALEHAHQRMRKDAAVGVDGVTKDQYGQELSKNLADLHERLKTKRYRHQLIRRVHIPKPNGKTRPIGVSTVEDKLVQDVVREVLGAIYEQDFLDCSCGSSVSPRLIGEASLVRYADDFVLTFERRDDAERVWRVIGKRMQRFGLTLHPDKSRLFSFDRPSRGQGGKGPTTFDFLGFTHYWRRSRRGNWMWACKTRREGLRRALQAVADWCRRHRHWSWTEQHAALSRRVRGHVNYFGVNGNGESLERFIQRLNRIWYAWLRRRSQRSSMRWDRFNALLKACPLPAPLIKVQIWEPRPCAVCAEEPDGGNLLVRIWGGGRYPDRPDTVPTRPTSDPEEGHAGRTKSSPARSPSWSPACGSVARCRWA